MTPKCQPQSTKNITATIEKLQLRDLRDLEKLFTSAFVNELPVQRIRQRIRRMRQFYVFLLPLSYLSSWVNNLCNIYVCRVNTELRGFIQLSRLNRRQFHLDYLAVASHYRGQGLGSQIVNYILKHVIDPCRYDLVLEVKASNPARYLYKRLGFMEITSLLHFEKVISYHDSQNPTAKPFNLRKRQTADADQLYRLYLNCIPQDLRQVLCHEASYFRTSLCTRMLEQIKNSLMGNKKTDYVLENKGMIIASIDIYSYPRTNSHTVSIMLDPAYEQLREELIRQTLWLIKSTPGDTVHTTIYDDNPHKTDVLHMLGFSEKEAYQLMIRHANITS